MPPRGSGMGVAWPSITSSRLAWSSCLQSKGQGAPVPWDGELRGFLLETQRLRFPALEAGPKNWGVFLYFLSHVSQIDNH